MEEVKRPHQGGIGLEEFPQEALAGIDGNKQGKALPMNPFVPGGQTAQKPAYTRNGYGVLISADYDLDLTRLDQKKSIWKAKTKFGLGSTLNRSGHGASASLVNAIVARMADDGLLHDCAVVTKQ